MGRRKEVGYRHVLGRGFQAEGIVSIKTPGSDWDSVGTPGKIIMMEVDGLRYEPEEARSELPHTTAHASFHPVCTFGGSCFVTVLGAGGISSL